PDLDGAGACPARRSGSCADPRARSGSPSGQAYALAVARGPATWSSLVARPRARLALAVVVADVAVGAAKHHAVVGVARPHADLVAIGVDSDRRLVGAGEHHDPRVALAGVAHLVGSAGSR